MAERPALALRARTVLPISQPPIENGAVLISGNRIRAVCSWAKAKSVATKVTDLGEVILLPGLVNAHCHLDYTDMAGELSPPKHFTSWIAAMLDAKARWNYSEYANSWLRGAHMLLRTGTTTVADIEAVPELLPEVWEATPLRVHSFLEMTGVRSKRNPLEILEDATRMADNLEHLRCRAALSPHAPYSTLPELIRATAQVSRKRDWPFCMHVAESAHEFDMFMHGHGEMFKWLNRNKRDMSDCGDVSPVQQVDRLGALDRHLLAVHVNYLAEGDAAMLAKHHVNVVHCPRSHEYFSHTPFPYRLLKRAGVNICLGTDSLATVLGKSKQKIELSMLEETRAFASAHESLSAREILQMATINGARALGLAGQVGELSEDALADIIAIPATTPRTEAHEAVLYHTGPVAASMIDGRWAVPPRTV